MDQNAEEPAQVLPGSQEVLEYAVAEHRQSQAFLISEKDYLDVRGADGKRRNKAVLTDAEVLELIQLLPETWGNVIKVCRAFGVRSWEVAFIIRATNEEGEPHIEWATCGSQSKSL